MKKNLNKISYVLVVLLMAFMFNFNWSSNLFDVYAEQSSENSAVTVEVDGNEDLVSRVRQAIESSANIITDNKDINDFEAIGIARAGVDVPDKYFNALDIEELHSATDYARTILGVLSIEKDPTDINGVNLVEKLCEFDLLSEANNGLVYGLLALDAGEYDVPEETKWTREDIINKLIENQNDDNGWSFFGEVSDPDMTGMVMTALSKYNNDNYPNVVEVINKSVEFLSDIQVSEGEHIGGFEIGGTYPTPSNANSTAQVVMGLSANNIDPTGEEFTKEGVNVVEALLGFEIKDGGFGFIDSQFNRLANAQALYALDQYLFFVNGTGSIFDWTEKLETEPINNNQVEVRVEGSNSTLYKEKVTVGTATNALELLIQAVGEDKVNVQDGDWGKYILGICDEIGNGWMDYLVKDGEVIVPMTGVEGQDISEIDEIVFYAVNSTYSTMIPNIEVTNEGNSFEITVSSEVTDWNTGEVSTVAVKDVEINIGDIGSYKTDENGKVKLNLPKGTFIVEISKFTENGPEIVKQSIALNSIGEYNNNQVQVRVEGSNSTLYKEEVTVGTATNALELLIQAVGEDKVNVQDGDWGKYILGICDEIGNGWMDYIVKDGEVIVPMAGIEGQDISEIDEIVFYAVNSTYSTMIPNIEVTNEGNSFEITVSSEVTDWNTGEVSTVAVKDVEMNMGDMGIYKTDENGKVKLNLPKGTFIAEVSKYTENGPEIVKQSLIIESQGGIVIENLTEKKQFNLNSTAKVKVKYTNYMDSDQEVALIMALFTKQGKLINYVAIEQELMPGQYTKLAGNLKIPESGDYEIRVMNVNNIDDMEPLGQVIKFAVE